MSNSTELILTRTEFTKFDTVGDITSADPIIEYTWFTLELPNIDGRPGSCIPQGRYNIKLAPSPKFLKSTDPWVQQYASQMPHIIGIPGRSNILIHWGNTVEDTEGCILLGVTHPRGDFIARSREAFEGFHRIYKGAMEAGTLYLTVIGGAAVPVITGDTIANEAIHLDAMDN